MPGSADLMEGMAGLDAVAAEYVRLWSYYDGPLPEHYTAAKIRQLISSTGTPYRIRLAKKPVDALANRVSIASITSSRGDQVNARIEEMRNANDMELQEPFLHTRLLALGDAYLLVYPVTSDEDGQQRDGERIDAVPDADTRAVGVEFAYQSPISCRAFYDAEDGRRIRFVIRRWKEKGPVGDVWRAEVWYADRLEAWVTNPGANGNDDQEWFPYAEDDQGKQVPATEDNWPEEHDFEEIPIKHARTDLPYGRSAIADFIGVQNMITKAVATQANGIESHGWRDRWRIADDAAILDQARDTVNWDDAADAPDATTAKPGVVARRTGAGTEQLYHGTKAVGEFSAPDLKGLSEPIESWLRLASIASATPMYEFDPASGDQMSGIARKRADQPMRNRETHLKRFLLRFWREVYTLGLKHVGISNPGELTVNWMPPAVEDDPDWWAVASIRREHGVPQRVILQEANYTEEDITAWEKDQDEGVFLDAGIDRLIKLGEAMQALGTGVSLLGIPPDRITTLVDRILGEAGAPGRTDIVPPTPPIEEETDDDPDE